MSTDQDESLVRELAEPLVAQFSPAEQDELFAVLSEAHFADPQAYAREDARAAPLAFGLSEVAVLLTPVMLAAMDEAVRYVVARAFAKGAKVTAAAIRRLFGRGPVAEPAAEPALTLTSEQWSELRQIVERVALKGGVPANQAELIAFAVVGHGRSGHGAS